MNKKQAIAYAQITLDTMLNSTYKNKINLYIWSSEMEQAFKIYPRNIVMQIANAKLYAEKMSKTSKRSDVN